MDRSSILLPPIGAHSRPDSIHNTQYILSGYHNKTFLNSEAWSFLIPFRNVWFNYDSFCILETDIEK